MTIDLNLSSDQNQIVASMGKALSDRFPVSRLRGRHAASPDQARLPAGGKICQNFMPMDKSPKAVAIARKLRGIETEAERRLWSYLRDRRLTGFKFRRQVPIPPFIADFACLSHELIVEVDGATHGDALEVLYDERRSQYLQSKGFAVHRVQNVDVLTTMTGVLDGILIVLQGLKRR